LEKTIDTNTKGIRLFYSLFDELGYSYVRSAANFVTLTLNSQTEAEELAATLLKEGVFVRHLIAFGLPRCVRVSVGTDRENEFCAKIFRKIKS
jgi:histidinol-phosphate aminotransferase